MNNKRPRSPRFPFIGLENAVKQLAVLHEKGVISNFSPADAASALEFSSMHGRAVKVFAALRAYGLIDKNGETENERKVFSISKRGLRIVEFSANQEKLTPILQRAALSPMIYRGIFERSRDVSEEDLASRLVKRGFTENGATRAAKVYVKNRRFAKLGELQELPSGLPQRGKAPQVEEKVVMAGLNLPLSTGRAIVPMGITPDEFQLLMQTLRLWKDKLVA